MPLSNAEIISFGSLCVSVIAASIAARSLRNSSKALKLAESDSLEKRMGIEPYLIQARKVVLKDQAAFAAFAVSYTNRSSLANTLAKVELLVTYLSGAREARQILLQPETSFPADIAEIKCLAVPINLPARSSTSGWFVFRLPEHVTKHSVRNYDITGYTAQGSKVSVTSYLLMDTIFHG